MGKKVLVADASATMRKIIVRSLQSISSNDVFEASDGREAFDQFSDHAIELVITGWNMPNTSGIELLKMIRRQDCTIPIVMVTTELERDCVTQAIQAGVTDYLAKPFEADVLRNKLKKYVAEYPVIGVQ